MEKHTPGPWAIAEAVEHPITRTNMRRIRSAHEGAEHGAVCEVYGARDGSTAHANALLVVQAPMLLAALDRLAYAAERRDNTMGDAITLIAVKSELAEAARHARSVIAQAVQR